MKVEKRHAEPEIPTASMADIAFLLIVFFMITSVFSVTRGLEFQLPKNDDSPQQPDSAEEAIHATQLAPHGFDVHRVESVALRQDGVGRARDHECEDGGAPETV